MHASNKGPLTSRVGNNLPVLVDRSAVPPDSPKDTSVRKSTGNCSPFDEYLLP